MEKHRLIQGSKEWSEYRANHFNASDAPAMLGMSKYKKRDQLIREYATGIADAVDADTQRRFDDGHRAEALARPLAEEIIGQELYPVVGSSGKYSASFDGLTIAEDIALEHKSLNDDIRACREASDLHPMYRVQMEQQLMVSGAEKCLFLATKWDGETCVEKKHFWYYPDAALRKNIIAGWERFESDVCKYVPEQAAPVSVAAPIEALPALTVELVGEVRETNLVTFKASVMARIQAISTDLKTDDDFATAKATVKFLDDGEKRLTLVKSQALAQTQSIDELFRTIDALKEEMRSKRLALDKLVVAREKAIKEELVFGGTTALAEHIAALNKQLGKNYMPIIKGDFAGAIKNKRTIASLKDAISTELARAKIEANEVSMKIGANLNVLRDLAKDHAFLFSDAALIVLKDGDDFTMLVKSRIAEHEAAEAKRLEAERERIRKEESERIERENKAKLEAEQKAAAEQEKGQNLSSGATPVPQVAPVSVAAPKPSVKLSSKGGRPSDDDMIKVLALHYRVHESSVIKWLLDVDLDAASKRMVQEFAA